MISHDDLVARDGDLCHWCRRPVPPEARTRDHLIPVSAPKRPRMPAPVVDHAEVLGGPRLSPALRKVGYQQTTVRTRHFRVQVMVDGALVDRCGWCCEPWPCPPPAAV